MLSSIKSASIFCFASLFCVSISISACSSDDGDSKSPSTGGTTSGGTTSGGTTSGGTTSGGTTGSCTGDITGCKAADLTPAQRADMCNLLFSAIDSPPGTEFKCEEGPQKDMSITVNGKDTCVSQAPPPGCPITVGQIIECYKAAKKDACGALSEKGACGSLFVPACSGGGA